MSGLYASPVSARRTGVLTVKQFGDKYKVSWSKSVRKKGYESLEQADCQLKRNSEKLSNNVARARSLIFEYAYCNAWDYFITLTINPQRYDRYDLPAYIKDLGKFFNNYNRNGTKVSYILIPEQHKDGAWHMHGSIAGILPEHLTINRNGYLDFPKYSEKFGFCSLSPIKSHEAVSKYITKYVTKELAFLPYGQRLYYNSHGLNKSKKIWEMENVDPSCMEWDYVHPDGYCCTAMTDSLDFLDSITLIP